MAEKHKPFVITKELFGVTFRMLRDTRNTRRGRSGNYSQEEFIADMQAGGYYTPSKGSISQMENGELFPGRDLKQRASFFEGSMEVLGIPESDRVTYQQVLALSYLAYVDLEHAANLVTSHESYADFAHRYARLISPDFS